jgi:hypothetical protein
MPTCSAGQFKNLMNPFDSMWANRKFLHYQKLGIF